MINFTRLFSSFSFIIVSLFSISSCVDKDFDLSKIDTENITVGSNYIVPMGNISIDISKYIFDFNDVKSKASISVYLEPIEEEYPIEAGFDREIVDKLVSDGTLTVIATVNNILPVPLQITATFINPTSGNVVIVNNKLVESAGGETRLESEKITREMLNKIAESKSIKLWIRVKDGVSNNFTFDQDILETLSIKLCIRKTGGIKF